MELVNKVSIRPKVSMLSILKHIEYETWFAIAEFIDNAIASYLANKRALEEKEGADFKLAIKIELNEFEDKITIRDNAAGIAQKDYARAFRAAEIPPDNSGLSEFGMGMKSAACWFSDKWVVTSSALGETEERSVTFDLDRIFQDKIEELDVASKPAKADAHYTKIELFNATKMPKKLAVNTLKKHLSSIYRDFLRKGTVSIKVDTEELTYTEIKVLTALQFNKPDEPAVKWIREIDFELEPGQRVTGFVAIREKASTTHAGFALFRRGRVIQGSYDTPYRPVQIFGHSNSYRYQRIFGELHLEGFAVNFTKKGIQWDDQGELFLKYLRNQISSPVFPLLQQAEQHRARASEKEYQNTSKVLDGVVKDLGAKGETAIADTLTGTDEDLEAPTLPVIDKVLQKSLSLQFNDTTWNVQIELSYEESPRDLIEIASHKPGAYSRDIMIRVALAHPFMIAYVGVDSGKLEPVLRMCAVLAISEILAKESGIKTQGEVRRNFNDLIYHLSI